MPNYGYLKTDQGKNKYKYNRALFENMKYFVDCTWEINLADETVIMLCEDLFPQMVGKKYEYDEVMNIFSGRILYHTDRDRFKSWLEIGRLKELRTEEIMEFHVASESRLPERYRVVITPVLDDNGDGTDCVYLSAKNIEKDLGRMMRIEEEKNAIYSVMGSNYPCVLYANLTQNTCDAYVMDGFDLEIPIHSSYDETFHRIRMRFNAEDKKEYGHKFSNLYSRKALTEHFLQSSEPVEMEISQDAENGSHWVLIKAVRLSKKSSGDLVVITLISIIDAQKELERLSSSEQ